MLAGREDAFIPYDGVEASVSLFRNARLVGFERCGHAPHLELGDAYRAELLAFASMLDGQTTDRSVKHSPRNGPAGVIGAGAAHAE
jgi:hypothetical protein